MRGGGRTQAAAPAGGEYGTAVGVLCLGARGTVCVHTPAQPAPWGEVLHSTRLVRAAPDLPLPGSVSLDLSLPSLPPVLAVVRCPSPWGALHPATCPSGRCWRRL